MKKKVLAIMSAFMITMLSSMTALAASPVPAAVLPQVPGQALGVASDTGTPDQYAALTGASAGLKVESVSQTTYDSAKVAVQNIILRDIAAVAAFLGDANLAAAATQSNAVVGAAVLATVEVKVDTATKDKDGLYTVTLTNPQIAANDSLVILHWNGSSWEIIKPSAVGTGAVTFRSATLSPITIVKVAATTPVAAPKTGVSTSILMVLAALCLAGAAFAAVKSRRIA